MHERPIPPERRARCNVYEVSQLGALQTATAGKLAGFPLEISADACRALFGVDPHALLSPTAARAAGLTPSDLIDQLAAFLAELVLTYQANRDAPAWLVDCETLDPGDLAADRDWRRLAVYPVPGPCGAPRLVIETTEPANA